MSNLPKRFFNFSETLHSCYLGKIIVQNFRVLVKQLFYGNEIQFFRKKILGDFFVKKNPREILIKMNPYQI